MKKGLITEVEGVLRSQAVVSATTVIIETSLHWLGIPDPVSNLCSRASFLRYLRNIVC